MSHFAQHDTFLELVGTLVVAFLAVWLLDKTVYRWLRQMSGVIRQHHPRLWLVAQPVGWFLLCCATIGTIVLVFSHPENW